MTRNTHARYLRKNMTDAEQRLWGYLKRRQVGGFKLRRQCPIGSYIVDFVCFEAMLIIEVDGGQHNEQTRADAERTDWLRHQGYRVLRFWNHDVLRETDSVVQTVADDMNRRVVDPMA